MLDNALRADKGLIALAHVLNFFIGMPQTGNSLWNTDVFPYIGPGSSSVILLVMMDVGVYLLSSSLTVRLRTIVVLSYLRLAIRGR